jgi:potassium-dependent mechanosensitive channel
MKPATNTLPPIRFLGLAFAFLSLLACLVSLGPEAARADQEWRVLLSQSREELADVNGVLRVEEEALPGKLDKLDAKLDELTSRLNQALLLKVMATVDDNPWILSFARKRVGLLSEAFDDVLRPMNRGRNDLEAMGVKIDQAKAQFGLLMAQSEQTEVREAASQFLTELAVTETKVKSFIALLDRPGKKIDGLRYQIAQAKTALDQSVPEIWRQFFFMDIPSLFSGDLWAAMVQESGTWQKIRRSSIPSVGEIIAGLSMSWTALVSAVISLLTIAALRLARNMILCDSPPVDALRRFRQGGVLFGCGMFFASLSLADSSFFVDICADRLGYIAASAGMILLTGAVLACRGRLPLASAAKPLWPLWALSIVSHSYALLQLPLSLIAPVQAAALLACFLASRNQYRKLTPGFDRNAAAAAAGFLAVALVFAVTGRASLTIFAGLNMLMLGMAVYLALAVKSVIGPWREDARASLWKHGLIALLGYPVILAASYLAILWLFTAHTGAWTALAKLFSQVVEIEGLHFTPKGILMILAGFYLARSLIFVCGALIRKLPDARPDIDRGMAESLRTIVKYALWGVYVIAVLYLLGFSLTSLTVVAGGLSVGVGFGLQNIVNNFISGLILLFGRSILVGDTLQLGDIRGVVRKVYIRNTVVQTFDNATVFIPNSELISGRIINWSHRDKRVRISIPVGVAYGSDVKMVERLLLEAAARSPHTLAEPPPDVLFTNFGASTQDFTLRVWVDRSNHADAAGSHVRMAIDTLFREAAVEIAFPQTDLHIKTAPALELLEKLRSLK